MKSSPSLATIKESVFEEENEKLFMTSLASLDPELFRIRRALIDFQINPTIIPHFISAKSNVERGGGWGKVIIEVRDGIVEKCASESTLRDSETTKLTIVDLRGLNS